jgi:chemotaxis protein histidine kinase CheA
VNKAVEKLGGQIKIESEHGKGTQFDIVLPNRVNKESNTNNQIH